MEKFNQFYNSYQYDLAYQLIHEIENTTDQETQIKIQKLKDIMIIVQISEQIMMDDEGWYTDYSNNNLKIQYKKLENQSNYTIKTQGVLNIPVFNLISVIYEIDLYKTWVPFCYKSDLIKQINISEKVANFEIYAPMLANREIYLFGQGIDRLDYNGTVIIIGQSIDKNERYQKNNNLQLNMDPNKVRVDLNQFAFEIKPITKNEFTFTTVFNIDPKINFLPQKVLNYTIRKFGAYFMQKIVKLSQNIKGSVYEQRQKEEQEFYVWVQSRIDQFFQ